jgi:hypothetical protein
MIPCEIDDVYVCANYILVECKNGKKYKVYGEDDFEEI